MKFVDLLTVVPRSVIKVKKKLPMDGILASELSLTLAEKEEKVVRRMQITSVLALATCGVGAYTGAKTSPKSAASYAIFGFVGAAILGDFFLITPVLLEKVDELKVSSDSSSDPDSFTN